MTVYQYAVIIYLIGLVIAGIIDCVIEARRVGKIRVIDIICSTIVGLVWPLELLNRAALFIDKIEHICRHIGSLVIWQRKTSSQ